MSLRTIGSFAVAILLGLIAVFLLRGVLSAPKTSGAQNAAASMIPVVVATAPIERGVTLAPTMLKVVGYPKDAVPVGAFQSLDQVLPKAGQPRTTQRSLAANEPVLESKLSGPGAKTTLSATILPGMRAVSIRSTDVSGVGGFVLPGDRVDVLLTRAAGSTDAAGSLTQVLAENALVLGVDQTSDQDSEKPVVVKAVTLEVTPEQAQTISLGGSVGQISLDLRQMADHAPLAKHMTTIADFGGPGPRTALAGAARKPARPRPRVLLGVTEVRVLRGVDATTYTVRGY